MEGEILCGIGLTHMGGQVVCCLGVNLDVFDVGSIEDGDFFIKFRLRNIGVMIFNGV